ncbi:hypothetical protein ACFE04_002405 [Oxalis oulophora]
MVVTTDKQFFSFIFFLLPLIIISGYCCCEVEGNKYDEVNDNNDKAVKRIVLFVYGSSYADTGNQVLGGSWNLPYGITFPGKPAGRFSDGRVFTDYVAKFVGVKSPIAYRLRKYVPKEHWKNGMNFAYGGSGVFDTLYSLPNMTTQIDFLRQLIIKDSVYTQADLNSSVALVVPAGNDYSAYLARNGTFQGLVPLITQVVKQLTIDLKRIQSLGVNKVAVTALAPLGCLPERALNITNNECNEQENQLATLHNFQLLQAVANLNNGTKNHPFAILDFYQAFATVLKNKGDRAASLKFESPLKPCCVGVSSEYGCGSVDENGAKKYSVCDDPQSSLFWDTVHPTQAGWRAVYLNLQSSLQQLVEKKTI